MARTIVPAALPVEDCAAICAILDRCSRAKPDEQYAETFGGIDDTHLPRLDSDLDLDDAVRLQAVRRRLEAAVHAFSGRPELRVDYTLFKRAGAGHRKGPHHDAGNPAHAHRIYTALLYLNDCDSGAVVFGPWRGRQAGRNAPGERLQVEERVLPAAGKLVLFDDAASNVHQVEEFMGQARYSVMSWFHVGSDKVSSDWVARYLVARPGTGLALSASDLAVEAGEEDSFRLRGRGRRGAFTLSLRERHGEWLDRLVGPPHFCAGDLLGTQDDPARQASLFELLCALAKAGAIGEVSGHSAAA